MKSTELMKNRTRLSVLAAVLLAGLTAPASAQTLPPLWGERDKLIFVSPTGFGEPGTERALCASVSDRYAVFFPFERQVHGYVLSKSGCRDADAEPLPADVVPGLKSMGVLPSAIPNTPHVPLDNAMSVKITIMVLMATLCLMPFLARFRRPRVSARLREVSGDPMYYDALLATLFHVARSDGIIERSEVARIREIYTKLTGATVTPEMTATHFTRFMTDGALMKLVRPYRDEQAEMLLVAAILVATNTTGVSREKKRLLAALSAEMECETAWFNKTLASAQRPRADTGTAVQHA